MLMGNDCWDSALDMIVCRQGRAGTSRGGVKTFTIMCLVSNYRREEGEDLVGLYVHCIIIYQFVLNLLTS